MILHSNLVDIKNRKIFYKYKFLNDIIKLIICTFYYYLMRNKLKIILAITIVYSYIYDILKIQMDITYTLKPASLLISK